MKKLPKFTDGFVLRLVTDPGFEGWRRWAIEKRIEFSEWAIENSPDKRRRNHKMEVQRLKELRIALEWLDK